MKYELQNVISGEGEVIYGNAIQAIANYLKRSTRASKLVEESEFFRKQETEILITFAFVGVFHQQSKEQFCV